MLERPSRKETDVPRIDDRLARPDRRGARRAPRILRAQHRLLHLFVLLGRELTVFAELTDDLLELVATELGVRRAFFARNTDCCSCTCCCCCEI
jgi:hypothetical protein